MAQHSPRTDNHDSASSLTRPPAPPAQYAPPAIIHRGTLETRAGSPLANPFGDPADPDNPLN